MIQVKNGKISIAKSRDLSPKQLKRLDSLASENDKKAYLLSILGLQRARHLPIDKRKCNGTDALSEKGTGNVTAMFQRILRNDGNVDHKPMELGNWIGVEIECLIPSAGGGEIECPDCEGSRVYEADCEECNGTGEVREECEECNGTGERTDANGDKVKCGTCDGKGHLDNECGACEGSGRYSADCPRCDGSGTIECDSDRDTDAIHESIRHALRSAKVYRASVRSDGSLSGEGKIGVEVTILLNTDNGWEPLERAMQVLRDEFEAEVNKTCGCHVHFDFRKAGREAALEAGKRLERAIPALALIVPESRRSNTYCKLSLSKFEGCRYHAVNLTSFGKHGSLEVRLHGGTLDARKVERWVTLLRKIMATERPSRGGLVTDVQGLIDAFTLDDSLCAYLDERWQKFNSEAIARAERMAREQREAALRAINADGTASEAIDALNSMIRATPIDGVADATSSAECLRRAISVLSTCARIDNAIVARGLESVTCRAITVLVTQGLSNAEIKDRLALDTESTVQALLASIYQCLGVASRAQLIVWCLPHLGSDVAPQAINHNGEVA